MSMTRKEFFEAIRDDFFTELTADFQSFKDMVGSALPVFGELEIEIIDKEDGGKLIRFIDRDKADVVVAPEGVNVDDVNTDMTTTILSLHLNKDNIITIVEHAFHMFTRANKNQVLLYASFIGKKIAF